jgi:hypothetical protein
MVNGILFYLFACLAVGFVGRNRRIGLLGFFLASIVLTPLITLLILVLSAPKKDLPRRHRAT